MYARENGLAFATRDSKTPADCRESMCPMCNSQELDSAEHCVVCQWSAPFRQAWMQVVVQQMLRKSPITWGSVTQVWQPIHQRVATMSKSMSGIVEVQSVVADRNQWATIQNRSTDLRSLVRPIVQVVSRGQRQLQNPETTKRQVTHIVETVSWTDPGQEETGSKLHQLRWWYSGNVSQLLRMDLTLALLFFI